MPHPWPGDGVHREAAHPGLPLLRPQRRRQGNYRIRIIKEGQTRKIGKKLKVNQRSKVIWFVRRRSTPWPWSSARMGAARPPSSSVSDTSPPVWRPRYSVWPLTFKLDCLTFRWRPSRVRQGPLLRPRPQDGQGVHRARLRQAQLQVKSILISFLGSYNYLVIFCYCRSAQGRQYFVSRAVDAIQKAKTISLKTLDSTITNEAKGGKQ